MYRNSCIVTSTRRSVVLRTTVYVQKRWKSKNSVLAKKKYPVDRALEHYDDFYKTVFGRRWPSIRLALLSPHKYCAVINNFGDSDIAVSALQNIGALNMRTLFELEKQNIENKKQEERRKGELQKIFNIDRKLEELAIAKQQEELESLYPNRGNSEGAFALGDVVSDNSSSYMSHRMSGSISRKVLTFERGNISSFPSPKCGSTGVLNYYMLDGSSLLPVLALGLNPGDTVLDMCAAPGGKSLLMLQTLLPAHIVCNDIRESRIKRIKSVIKQYLYDSDKWKNQLIVTQRDGRDIDEFHVYNKILVDVPCTTDRHCLHDNENNIFTPGRTKERLKIPELQAELLSHALKIVQPGGTVVYSTCSLSPVQNDGVVHMALRKVWEETDIQVVVKDMTAALEPVECVYKLGHEIGLKYGHLVLPFIPCNFGPMYFCKLVRTK